MNSDRFHWQYFPRFTRFGLLWVVLFSNCFLSASAELLVRWSEGGPDRYTGVFGPIAIGFTVDEPTRIEAVRSWIWRDGPVTASLLLTDLSSKLYSETFISVPPPSQSNHTPPAHWQGRSSLRWDVQPGDYYLSLDEGFFPIGYPVIHPNPPGVKTPFDFESMDNDRWEPMGFPFGVEIYGQQLSAIPEPATYGLVASAALLGLATFRQRRGAAKRK